MQMPDLDVTYEYPEAVDKVVTGGWPDVILGIRQLTQCLLYLIHDFARHRRHVLSAGESAALRLYSLTSDPDEIAYLLEKFEPGPIELTPPVQTPRFDLGQGRSLPLGNAEYIGIGESFQATEAVIGSAVGYMVEQPHTAPPTFNELAELYIELARMRNMQVALQTFSMRDLSSPSLPLQQPATTPVIDYFAVGQSIAAMLSPMISPHQLAFTTLFSLPENADLDCIVAAHLAAATLDPFNRGWMFRSESFDPQSTHSETHCTIGVGEPYHAPERLCFDSRTFSTDVTNTELIVAYREDLGMDNNFARPLVELVRNSPGEDPQSAFLPSMIRSIQHRSSTASLAMSAISVMLESRFKTP